MIWHGPGLQLAAVGSIAIEPVASEAWESVMGAQLAPAFELFQTPPAAAPR